MQTYQAILIPLMRGIPSAFRPTQRVWSAGRLGCRVSQSSAHVKQSAPRWSARLAVTPKMTRASSRGGGRRIEHAGKMVCDDSRSKSDAVVRTSDSG